MDDSDLISTDPDRLLDEEQDIQCLARLNVDGKAWDILP